MNPSNLMSNSATNQLEDNPNRLKLLKKRLQNRPLKRFISPFYKQQFNPFDTIYAIQQNPFANGKKNTTIHKVFVNFNKPNEKIYILKRIIYTLQEQNIAEQTFQRQKYYLQNIKSQNCIKYYGIQKKVETNNNYIKQIEIFMEFCQGDNKYDIQGNQTIFTLRNFIDSQTFKETCVWREKSQEDQKGYQQLQHKIIQIVLQIFMGLYDLNHNKIIHRDLKPENILFKSDGTIKISDFDTINNYYQDDYHNCGTFAYRAYETVFQCGQTSALKLDIWSLGVIIYEMFNKHRNGKGDMLPYCIDTLKVKNQNIMRQKLNCGAEELTKIIYAEMKQRQNNLQQTQIFSENLKPLSKIINKMLQIQNYKRYSCSELYSDKELLKIIRYMFPRFNQQKRNKLMIMFNFKAYYAQIQHDLLENIKKKQSQFIGLKTQLKNAKDLREYLIASRINLNIQTTQYKQILNKKLLKFYKLLLKLQELYQLGRLHKKQAYLNVFMKILNLKYQLSLKYHANFGQKIDQALQQNLFIVASEVENKEKVLVNSYKNRRLTISIK